MNITLAKDKDLSLIMDMYSKCKKDMIKKGNDQWDGEYPDKKTIGLDIKEKNLYVIVEKGVCVAAIALNEMQAPEYENVNWQLKYGKCLVIHRLAVSPDFQGRGIAKNIMKFVEEKALLNAYKSIRLDTYCKNESAINFYKKCSYNIVGEVSFSHKSLPFKCFEKIL